MDLTQTEQRAKSAQPTGPQSRTNAGQEMDKPVSPVPSSASMKSDWSIDPPPKFTNKPPPLTETKPQTHRPVSPVPSCASMKSEVSMNEPPKFSSGPTCADPKPQTHRPVSPVPSCVSMKSEVSMNEPPKFSSGPPMFVDPKSQTHRPVSPVPSCVSMKSEVSMNEPPKFSSGPPCADPKPQTHRPVSPVPSCVSMKSEVSMNQPPKFSSGPPCADPKPQTHRPVSHSCVSMKSEVSMNEPPKFSSGPPPPDSEITVTQDQSRCGVCEQPLRDPVITTCGHSFCRQCISSYWSQSGPSGDYSCPQCRKRCRTQSPVYPRTDIVQPPPEHASVTRIKLTDSHVLNRVLMTHKTTMKRRCERICEGIMGSGTRTLLKKIFTDVYITEGESEGVNNEHEVWQIESVSRLQTTEDTPINCNDIFKPLSGQERHIRTVMTKGVAGIGKTVSVQKFILDWAEESANQDVNFMFMLPFRELNLVKHDQCSLHKLLLDFHPELRELQNTAYKDCHIVFIFDGLDESRLPLNFNENQKLSDVTQTSTVDVLMTSLIQGTLLPSALIWITSRPAAASQIPSQCISQVTEVRGFSDIQKDEYFKKKITDQNQADKVIKHMKAFRSLHIMCHVPVFCWMSATVLQQILEQDDGKEAPKTLTEMFIHFLLIQTTRRNQKYQEGSETDRQRLLESHKGVILKLAELAFKNLESGNLMFYEEDLRECGIDVSEASVYSGMCTEIFREECVFHHKKVYCFVHLSIQEFFAALHVFSSFLKNNTEVLEPFLSRRSLIDNNEFGAVCLSDEDDLYYCPSDRKDKLHVLLKGAVDKALDSKNGHLDLFLRFLVGISVECNQCLLQCLFTNTYSSSNSIKDTCLYIKTFKRMDPSPERYVNLFHCLFEMNDHSLHKEVQKNLESSDGFSVKLSPAHCSALAHMLLISDEVLDEFDLKKYKTSEEGQRRLVPAVRCCRKARLVGCRLSEKSCEIVASALEFANSPLRELDLSHNDLQTSGEKLLSALHSPNCQLATLRLAGCNLTEESCEAVASALQSLVSLTELDLSHNDLKDSGVQLLSAGLSSPQCKLQTLRLAGCKLTKESCMAVASALKSLVSLTELDLSHNDLKDSGVQLLSAGLSRLDCQLQTLRLAGCNLTEESCEVVASALQSLVSLTELDLSHNDLKDSGVQLLSAGLSRLDCQLQTLRLAGCNLTEESCEAVASAVQSLVSLTELDLCDNDLKDSGVQLLSVGLSSPDCQLQTLRLAGCLITHKSCSRLASALKSNPSYLKQLDLSYNHLGDSGLRELTDRLNDPKCKLETFRSDHGGECRIKPGLRKYACELTLDPNTAFKRLSLSEGNRKVTGVRQMQSYPDHPERFDGVFQVLCAEGLTGRCYWEAERSGNRAIIAVAYKSISRKETGDYSRFGHNDESWTLSCSGDSYSAWHSNKQTAMPAPSSRSSRVGVYLDWPAGTLSFYSVSSDALTHLHTFHSAFTEPLYPGFGVRSDPVSLVCLQD